MTKFLKNIIEEGQGLKSFFEKTIASFDAQQFPIA